MQIIGMSHVSFERLSQFFEDMEMKVAIMDPNMVFGELHIRSAYEHAKRAFSNRMNRSNDMIIEFLLYMAGERQITKALNKMRPRDQNSVIVIGMEDPKVRELNGIPGIRNDSLIEGTEQKAATIGLDRSGLNISYNDLVLEMVAMTDILKM